MIRLSGTAADAAGAGQLQGSSGFGRRSLFRARRDGPDVPEKPVRRCFGQKVPGNGWAFANFFYLWRSKQYAMMDLKTIRAELRKLTAIVDGWEPSGEIPALERDLALEKLRTLYDAVRFTEVESLPESPVAETEPAAAPVPPPVPLHPVQCRLRPMWQKKALRNQSICGHGHWMTLMTRRPPHLFLPPLPPVCRTVN